MQVYRGMDIGTAKPTTEERNEATYHLIDVVDPEETFTVAEYQRLGSSVLARSDGTIVVVGGSGLHFRSLVDELSFPPHDPETRQSIESMSAAERRAELLRLDPRAAEHIDLGNERRVIRALEVAKLTGEGPSSRPNGMKRYDEHLPFRAVGIDPGDALPTRIALRLEEMLAAGLVAEVESLSDRLGRTASQAVGYRQLLPVVQGRRSLEDGVAATRQASMRLARQQRTFFRRDPRIHWLGWDESDSTRLDAARESLVGAGLP